MRSIIVIAHNLRSTHNVGSLLRTADGLGIEQVFLTGYTPHPQHTADKRLPHLARKIDAQINKTALGAQTSLAWKYAADVLAVITELRGRKFTIAALEQTSTALSLPEFKPPDKLALIVGREVRGIESEVLGECDLALEIPMLGQKESFNVAQAAAMALYHCRFCA